MTTPVGSSTTPNASLISGQQNLASSYTTFLSLLTTQLKNQDPTAPLDTNQFTQQLVQMTGVQQQLLSNELLQTLVGQSSGSQGVTGAVGMIGKTVEAANSNATLTDGKAKWSYNLAGAASNATLTISDASGKAVWTGTAPDLSSGTHGFTWDGKTTDGTQLANGGTYSLSIAATNANGAAVAGKAVVSGVVTAATNVNGVVMLKIGDASAPLSSVTSVSAS